MDDEPENSDAARGLGAATPPSPPLEGGGNRKVLARSESTAKTLRQLFLTLFLRGRSSRGLKKKSAPTSVARKLWLALLTYGLFGMVALIFRAQPIFLLSVYLHSVAFMFLGMFVSSSPGEILFNQDEADILMHRPIEPRTLLWAKVRVLAEVSVWLACAFNLVGFAVGALSQYGNWRYVPAHALSSIMQAFFCTGCVVLIYQLCLRWFGREKLDGLMTTAQVVFSLAAVLGSQMMPEFMKYLQPGDAKLTLPWWLELLPPTWFAGIDDALAGTGSTDSLRLAGIGCAATALVLWIAFGKLAQDYEAGLQMMNERSSRRITKGEGGRRRLDRLLEVWPLSWWLRDARERAAFLLTAAYLARDRDVKLRVYPALAPYLVLPVVFMVRDVTQHNQVAEHGPGFGAGGGFGSIFASVYLGLAPMMAINMLQFSQHWQASDIFRLAPVRGPGPICRGSSKAVMLFVALPMTIALGVSTWLIHDDPAAMALLAPGAMLLPVMALLASQGGKVIPLSHPVDEAQAASRGRNVMLSFMGTMVLAVIAFAASSAGNLAWLLAAEAIGVAFAYASLKRGLSRAKWPSLE